MLRLRRQRKSLFVMLAALSLLSVTLSKCPCCWMRTAWGGTPSAAAVGSMTIPMCPRQSSASHTLTRLSWCITVRASLPSGRSTVQMTAKCGPTHAWRCFCRRVLRMAATIIWSATALALCCSAIMMPMAISRELLMTLRPALADGLRWAAVPLQSTRPRVPGRWR